MERRSDDREVTAFTVCIRVSIYLPIRSSLRMYFQDICNLEPASAVYCWLDSWCGLGFGDFHYFCLSDAYFHFTCFVPVNNVLEGCPSLSI